jgi:iron complex outermembrane receptor protein
MFALSRAAPCAALLCVCATSLVAQADTTTKDSTRTTQLTTVTVIGSRGDLSEVGERLHRVAGGVSMVSLPQLRASRQANLHDALRFVPGVYIQPRFGAADESQISVRGSGLRNNFHARGINLLVNGMPYRNADGFTDFESLELLTAQAVEVYKGANALRYGGSTLGGAINLHTQTGYTAPPITAFLQGGSQGFSKAQLSTGGTHSVFDWYGSYANTRVGGYRDWSDQRRDRVNLHAGMLLGRATDLRTFYFFAHVKEHVPGSLTAAELESDPTLAVPTNVTNRWGRDYDLQHVGVQLRTQLTPTQRLEISPYLQYRDIDHPIFEVINQLSHDWGVEARYENATLFGDHENRLTVGVQPAYETMINKQFQNAQGEHGALTRDEHDYATTLAVYAENTLALTPTINALAGFRLERSTRRVDDFFVTNGDQSDRRSYDAFTPRLGLTAQVKPQLQLFANASRTVEPPLLLELSSFGNPGGFINLDPQSAWQYEVGARTDRRGVNVDISLYDIELTNELLNQNVQPFPNATFTVPTYRNVPRSRHAGVETGLSYQRTLTGISSIGGRLSYTYNRFRFVDDPTYASNVLPGAPSHYVSADVRYTTPDGLTVTPSVEWVPQSYFVTSANDASNMAWKTFGIRVEYLVSRLGANVFVLGQNLANARYSASVQVDNAAGRFFEPADPRSFYAGVRVTR